MLLIRSLVAATLLAAAANAQVMQRDVLAGHVTGPSGPVSGATVSVLAVNAPAGTFPQTARSDIEGRWLVAVQEGPGEYVVRVTAIGMTPKSVTAKRGEPRKPIIMDVKLEAAVVALDAMKITEQRRQRPPRQDVIERVGSDRATDGFGGSLASGDQGNLAAIAATVPGVMLIPDANGGVPGFSVLGLSADQNRVTLNGLSFSGGDIPRDAVVITRVASTSFDVSRGGFSGGQLAVTAPPGSNFSTRMAHVTFDSPSLQATDAVGRRLGAQYNNVQLSGMAGGPIVFNSVYYNVAAQLGRRSSDLQTLINNDPFVLQRVGVAGDSVSRLLGAMSAKHLPVSVAAVPADRLTDNFSLLGRLDINPSQNKLGNVLASVRHNTARASLLGATAVPGHGGDVITNGADVTGTLFTYTSNNFLNDLRVGARYNDVHANPYLELPDVRVLVSSRFDDSTSGVSTLQLGGNPLLPRTTRTAGAEAYDMLSWFTLDRRHRIRITANGRADQFSQEQYANRRGAFTFNSIADFEANRPAAYARTFASSRASAKSLTGSFSLGDDWRPGERSQFLYGVRVDANAFLDRPVFNPDIESKFGVRTDFVPRAVDLSPRIGFWRAFGTNGTTGIPGFGAPWGTVRGGIGLFRNDVAPTLVAPAMLATGLPSGAQQLLCVGPSAPVPNWDSYLADPTTIPSSCSGSGASSFATTRPNVWTIDSRFAAQRSWRANLALNAFLVPKLIRATVEGVYSLNLHQQAPLDLNFAPNSRFTLAAEDNRPVFAEASSIVPAFGVLTNRDSRVDASYGGVTSLRTDLRSRTQQLIFTLYPAPGDALGRFTQWQAAYTLQRVREESRGFGGTTSGNPLDVETTRGALDVRQQVTLSFSTRVGSLFSVATTARVASGMPFTPVVGGDINGDGLANDRAFIFNPAAADSTLRTGMTSLLNGASSRVKSCLEKQLGRIAKRNTCDGPWTSTMNAVLTLNPERLGMENRTQVSLSLTNLPAGLDALLHKSSRLQGWGQAAASDPNLLFVRGFDPASRRFIYEVNPRFGDTRVSRTGVRSPFLVTLEARVQLGRDYNRQSIEQAMAPGRTKKGDKLTVGQLKPLLLGVVFNPVRGLLQAKDSLSILSNEQLKALTALDRRVTSQEDSIVTPIAEWAASLPVNYSETEVLDRTLKMANALFDVVLAGMRDARNIFTPEQINEFPPFLRASFDINRLMSARPTKGFDPQW